MVTQVPEAAEQRSRMQRVRVGITGLAAVLLLVALATAIATGVRNTATNEAAPTIAPVDTAVDNTIEPTEPLAQLGVAPVPETAEEKGTAQQQ